jgi:cytochrome c553
MAFLLLYGLACADRNTYIYGETLYFSKGCNGCHGIKGEGLNQYPKLANVKKSDLIKKLEQFRKGISTNQQQEMMIPFAQSLTDEEIDGLTTFLSEFEDTQTESYNPSYETWGDGGS